jgi:hypothetical protein
LPDGTRAHSVAWQARFLPQRFGEQENVASGHSDLGRDRDKSEQANRDQGEGHVTGENKGAFHGVFLNMHNEQLRRLAKCGPTIRISIRAWSTI